MIVIPSYKRAGDAPTLEYLTEAKIAVHEFEAEEYRAEYGDRILTIPNDLQKTGMSTIRNYILDNVGSDRVLMMDDDIGKIGYYEERKRNKLDEQEVYEFVEQGFRMCEEAGTKLWGVNLQSDKKFYREYTPISLSNVVLGPFMGIIQDPDIRFDTSLGLKEDYDYSLQVLHKHRKILRFNKYHYEAGHIDNDGGATTYRTLQEERQQAERLQEKWGDDIVKIREETMYGNRTINPIVKVPITGV